MGYELRPSRWVCIKLVDMEIRTTFAVQFFSAAYARCTRVARRLLWSAINGLAGLMHGPWMVAGNFNVIMTASERVGGSLPNATNMEEFNQAMFHCA